MVRFRMMLVALIIMVATPNLFAAWKVVIDKNCIKVVSSNLASQKLIEGQHNQRLDSIAEKKKKVELYTVSMATIKELYKVTMQETQQLVGNFVNIVNNATIQNPLKGQGTAEKKNDGYNMLDRYERLSLANSIYSGLLEIRYKVEGMILMAQYATANDLFFAIDPEGWANVVTMKNNVSGLINDWNGLVASNY